MKTSNKITTLIVLVVATCLYVYFNNKEVIPTSAPEASSLAVFVDSADIVSFSYPKDFTVMANITGSAWRNNALGGDLLARMSIPRLYQPSTNFSEAIFTVGRSDESSDIENCLIATNGEVATGAVTINGVQFQKFNLGDAGAGNRYDTTSYRVVRNGHCVAVEYMVHTTNIANYTPDSGVKEYDSKKISTILEAIAQSFHFM